MLVRLRDGSSNAHALPPNDKATIERVFAPALDRLGVRLTRGALVDFQTGQPSPKGKHLAVYVEPTGDYAAEDYAQGTVRTLRAFIPAAFAVVKVNTVGSAGTSTPTPTSPSYDG